MIRVFYTNRIFKLDNESRRLLSSYPKHFQDKWGYDFSVKHPMSFSSKVLLAKALEYLNINTQILSTYTLGEMGKPDIDGDIFFNISHNKGLVAVAVSDCQVGVDVQQQVNKADSVLLRVCTERELDFFKSREELWTRKEALIKLLGKSILEGRRYEVLPDCEFSLTKFSISSSIQGTVATIEKPDSLEIIEV
ncbi:MAG: 4'-phosphopantetheinyl transferase superfamily protein [Saprospiraceae bacterium]|nr:4'-phosphopantetheinyl transferase superfamily protein [Saprospiraceae bacterium]